MTNHADELLRFIDASPTPYHAVASVARRLRAAGFVEISETEIWTIEPGARCFLIRDHGSLVAFEAGSQSPARAGFRVIGAHTDSPNFRVKPVPGFTTQGVTQIGVAPYGGVLLHSWLDRDLSLAGRVTYRDGARLATHLVDCKRPLLRIPNLAIHLNREISEAGLKLNPQQHLVPVSGLEGGAELAQILIETLRSADALTLTREAILGFDLMLYDCQPSTRIGVQNEFLSASRLDNLDSSYTSIAALLASAPQSSAATRVVVLYDHEEVGSRSISGAGGTLLVDTLQRITQCLDEDRQAFARAIANSLLVSADMAHAVHPNYADRHDANHGPRIGKGPVIKVHAELSYATQSPTAALFAALCAEVSVKPQYFAIRNDLRCGSTIGPIAAARTGIATVDVGNPMWAMHSCREIAGAADVEPMVRVLTAFLQSA